MTELDRLEMNVEQAIADFDLLQTTIENCGVDVPNGTQTSEYATKVEAVYEAGQQFGAGYVRGYDDGTQYAYDNPQTPTDDRTTLTLYYAYLNILYNNQWDSYFDEEQSIDIYPADYSNTHLESLEYPKGTQKVTDFRKFFGMYVFDVMTYGEMFTNTPVKKMLGVLDMSSATEVQYAFSFGGTDLGTIILPTNQDVITNDMFINSARLESFIPIGKFYRSVSFKYTRSLNLETAVRILNALEDYAGLPQEYANSVTFSSETKTLLDNAGWIFDGGINNWQEHCDQLGWNY